MILFIFALMKKLTGLLIVLFIWGVPLIAQTDTLLKDDLPQVIPAETKKEIKTYNQILATFEQKMAKAKPGKLEVTVDPRLETLAGSYAEFKKMYGYKVQLFSGRSRTQAATLKADFLAKYPEEHATIIYQQPNFKLRVGNYIDRLQAHKFLHLYKIDFPSAFLVQDEIEYLIEEED
jgi:hypothetical protein